MENAQKYYLCPYKQVLKIELLIFILKYENYENNNLIKIK